MMATPSNHCDFLEALREAWVKRRLLDAELSALYLLGWYWFCLPRGDIARVSNKVPTFSEAAFKACWSDPGRLPDIFESYRFRCLRASTLTLVNRWLNKPLPLFVIDFVPSPGQMLTYLAEGRRPVSLIFDPAAVDLPYGHHGGALQLAVHDLEHGARFLETDKLYERQTYFFKALLCLQNLDALSEITKNKDLANRWDYLRSDMNTDPHHSLRYLQAILKETPGLTDAN